MDSKIENKIYKIAKFELIKHTEKKQTSLMHLYYAGILATIYHAKLSSIAADLGCSIGGAQKLAKRFETMLNNGDIACHMLMSEFMKQQDLDYMPTRRKLKRKPTTSLGFRFTSEEELNMQNAMRQSILFMQDYGKGQSPRLNGEYFSPDSRPCGEKGEKWLTLDAAMWYCNLSKREIIEKAKSGDVERRVYKVDNGRSYYEYKVRGLDKIIVKNINYSNLYL